MREGDTIGVRIYTNLIVRFHYLDQLIKIFEGEIIISYFLRKKYFFVSFDTCLLNNILYKMQMYIKILNLELLKWKKN
mgnify:CR=1 FL=1